MTWRIAIITFVVLALPNVPTTGDEPVPGEPVTSPQPVPGVPPLPELESWAETSVIQHGSETHSAKIPPRTEWTTHYSPKTLFHWNSGSHVLDPQDDELGPIVTDRPDFTEASSTVGKGVFQIETGYTFIEDNEGGHARTHSFPEMLFRVGMFAEWFEFRFAFNHLDVKEPGLRRNGGDDLYLGAKIGLTPQEGWLPEMALIPQMFIQTGPGEFADQEVLPGVNWVYSWEVAEWVSVGGSTQVNRVQDGTGHFYAEVAQSVTGAFSLTDRFGIYTEFFSFYPNGAVEPGVGPEHFFNGGFTVLVSDDLQLDVRAGTGLNKNADDVFAGAGLSARF